MNRVEQRESLVIDHGDFYEVENSMGLHYVPFEGENGQSDPARVLLEHFGIGEIDSENDQPFQYDSVFESLNEAQKQLLQRLESEEAELDEENLCSRCESRPIKSDGLCGPCIEVLAALKGAV